MVEIDIDVTAGGVMAIAVAPTSVDATPFPGGGYLVGWSLRDASTGVPTEASGLVVAPGAGATIVQLAALPAGEYEVTWTVGLQGAAAAADANNFELFDTAGNVIQSINPGLAGDYPQNNAVITVTAGQTIGVKAIGAGTAGVTYSADITIDPTAFPETVIEIRDGANAIGAVSFQSERASTQWFGPNGPCVNAGVTLHVISGVVSGAIYVVPSRP